MKLPALILILCLILSKTSANEKVLDIENIRINYEKAVLDKKICGKMIEELNKNKENPVCLAYLGAFRIIWAKHIINPFARLNTFNKGKKDIERAVEEESNNIEIRFIRLSIQKNCPSFLGYDSNIEQDKKFIHTNKKNINSAQLKEMIAAIV